MNPKIAAHYHAVASDEPTAPTAVGRPGPHKVPIPFADPTQRVIDQTVVGLVIQER